jgi:hypothetical protein
MPHRRSQATVTQFLRDALAVDELGVPELEARARATGLLGERQSITHIKVFKRAKKSLGIRSLRAGFGARSQWRWQLPRQSEGSLKTVSGTARERRGPIPIDWVQGVACLHPDRPPSDSPSAPLAAVRGRLQEFLELAGKVGRARRRTRLGRDGSIRLCAQAAPRLSR